jgi:iron complex transport system substrate-binding protein
VAAHPKGLIAAALLLLLPEMGSGTISAKWCLTPFREQAARIVSLVPALTEILFAIGAGPQVIAVSSFDDDPPEVERLPRVGALLDPDTERILALRPDLVLIYGSQVELSGQLTAAGIRTFSYRHGGLDDLRPSFIALGELTGREEAARRAIDAIDARFEAVRSRVAGRRRPSVLLVIGHEPKSLRHLDASGGAGFLHDLVELAGGRNVLEDIDRQAVRVSTEMLIARAPDVVVDLHYTREMTEADRRAEQETWKGLSSVPAVRNGRIHVLHGDRLVVPGPRIADAAEEYARAIHPEAYR